MSRISNTRFTSFMSFIHYARLSMMFNLVKSKWWGKQRWIIVLLLMKDLFKILKIDCVVLMNDSYNFRIGNPMRGIRWGINDLYWRRTSRKMRSSYDAKKEYRSIDTKKVIASRPDLLRGMWLNYRNF